MGEYLGSIDITGTVALQDIEELFQAPNNGASLGIVIVRNLVVDSASEVKFKQYPIEDAEGTFEVRSIQRELSEHNRVRVSRATSEVYPERLRSERIFALGKFSGLVVETLFEQAGDYRVDYKEAGLLIRKASLRDPFSRNSVIQLAAWKNSPSTN